ncbi:MAG: glycosyl hydrolase family 65 protein [Phycisphaerae bacterium]
MSWEIRESELPLDEPDFLSAIFTVGNGQICTRGTLGEQRHEAFRGTYVSGLYTRAGYGLVYFLGAPDWLPAFVRIGGRLPDARQSHRALDMRNGVLTRTAEFCASDTTVRLTERRFASLEAPWLLCQRVELEVSGGGEVEVFLGVDGDVRNHPAKYYKPGQLPNVDETGLKLAEIESVGADQRCCHAAIFSRQTLKRALVAAVVRQTDGEPLARTDGADGGLAGATFRLPAGQGGSFAFEKLCGWVADVPGVNVCETDRDAFVAKIAEQTFPAALDRHEASWQRFWDVADVRIEADEHAQQAVRFAIYSTRIAAANDDGASSVGAKNLTGDWYRGAVFWDMEMYQIPLLAAVAPELARNHILYRRRRLDSARTLAAQDGYEGARFPWHSFQSGLEEPPAIGGQAYQQVHLNVAVPWGILHYHELTGDDETLLAAGLEVLIEQCRFWASRVEWDDDSYHIRNICGPDEIHKGIDDDAYTCVMVRHILRRADGLIGELSHRHGGRVRELLEGKHLGFDDAERQLWRDIAEKLHVPRLGGGELAQFEGIEKYSEPSPAAIRDHGEAGDKRHKQADALMVFHALPRMFDDAEVERNFLAHAPLCDQTSSLSTATHALLAARLRRARDARRYFQAAAGVDLEDSFGNTRHGIHGAGEGGIWMAVVHGFGGLRVGEQGVAIEPQLPPQWSRLDYSFLLAGQCVRVAVEKAHVQVTNAGERAVELTVCSQAVSLAAGESKRIEHRPTWREELEGVVIGPAVGAESAGRIASSLRSAGLAVGAFGPIDADLREQVDAFTPADALTDMPPDAQGYYVTAQRLRRLPWNCVGICGSADEVSAAHSAGMTGVGVGKLQDADLCVDGADGLSVDTLRDVFLRCECRTNPYYERNVRKMRMEMG